ncbi:Sialidase [Cladorrhinum sp. PSN332]|nr:Sialidase [Cladorrhinum sp. PSN332]
MFSLRRSLGALALIQLVTCSQDRPPHSANYCDPVYSVDGCKKVSETYPSVTPTRITTVKEVWITATVTAERTVTLPPEGIILTSATRTARPPPPASTISPQNVTDSSSTLLKVQKAAEPALINPDGVYLRAGRLFNKTNEIIVGYAGRSPSDPQSKALLASISNDGGKSWHYRGEVTSVSSPGKHDLDNAFPLQLPSGRILFAFRNHDVRNGKQKYFRITVCASDDGGRTWFFLSQVDERERYRKLYMNNGLWEPFMRLGRKGEVQVYYSDEITHRKQNNVMRYSRDGGRTWSEEKITVSSGPNYWPNSNKDLSRDGMMGIAERNKEGGLICIFESTHLGVYSITTVNSDDDGYTWKSRTEDRSRVYTAANGKNAGAPQIVNVGGALVASFMTNERSGTDEVDGGEVKLVVSVDEGKTWSDNGLHREWQSALTVDSQSHWPGLFALDDEQFLVLYSRDSVGAVSQRYKLVPVLQ